ncbi:MAG: LPS-assembly protein LptD [Bordetella sp.]|nr:MAG: LPS-assembly protein LptD [Bordetella sp.]
MICYLIPYILLNAILFQKSFAYYPLTSRENSSILVDSFDSCMLHKLKIIDISNDKIQASIKSEEIKNNANNLQLTEKFQICQIDTIIKGNLIKYYSNTGDIYANGKVRIISNEYFIAGTEANFNRKNSKGTIKNSMIFLPNESGYAKAKYAYIMDSSKISLKDAIYTGCCDLHPEWYFQSSKLDLNLSKNEGIIKNGIFYFKKVPILYSPYLTFPLKKEKKSGFLFPKYDVISRNDFNLTIPYYLNLSKNYDATLNSRYSRKYGLFFDIEFRYLNDKYQGIIKSNFLIKKHKTINQNYWFYYWQHNQILKNGFYINCNCSDIYDKKCITNMLFNNNHEEELQASYLFQQGQIGKIGKIWNGYVQLFKYFSLEEKDSNDLLFNKIPEFVINGDYNWKGFNTKINVSAVRFVKNTQEKFHAYEGSRFQIYPSISYPIKKLGWSLNPKIGIHHTKYQNSIFNLNDNKSRNIPIISIDNILNFQRETKLLGNKFIQTITPRIFYLYIPYHHQGDFPIYDTTLSDFNFSQAFKENIYLGGWDRIANANHATTSITMRWFDKKTGVERVSLSGLQRFHFNENIHERLNQKILSNFLFVANATLAKSINLTTNSSFNLYERNFIRSLFKIHWSPKNLTNISISYRYRKTLASNLEKYQCKDQQKHISLSFQWPFSEKLYGVGCFDYPFHSKIIHSISDSVKNRSNFKIIESIIGAEYKDKCWIGRVVFHRSFSFKGHSNTALLFQIEFSGLGSLGYDPTDFLTKKIIGYERLNNNISKSKEFVNYFNKMDE